MTGSVRIALIHATRVAIDPIEEAFVRLWPEAETVTILEEGLSIDRARSDRLTPELQGRIVSLARYADCMGVNGIQFTCSAFGAGIEEAANQVSVPVYKPNEAMFEAAFEYGDNAVMIYTFEPAASGMEAEFKVEAIRRNSAATLHSIYCDGALDAKRKGDAATHDRLIAETAQTIESADVVLLAQFSMASAASLIRSRTVIPVLASPESAVNKMRSAVQSNRDGEGDA